ncbi:metallophosphoesterase [Halopelagius longus]|uniref:Calcineurin-like phosphoesterase n=1 Tax=Halopelagius longus TaxID=1236180 RepID=A0A1H1FYP5_9EURY|nr:metallophosphoesterase [Halopelagius longus]SDR06045.1 Calcineurin-like phosphoesterase [Halopelagius longus]
MTLAPESLSDIDADAPTVVSVSDIHGYLSDAKSALELVGEAFDRPLVDADEEGRLHWAGGDEYVLVFLGDTVDRGPSNTETLETVWRLREEAPPGHVVHLLGNHEANVLFPHVYHWEYWYSADPPAEIRKRILEDVAAGRLAVAFEAYGRTYVHAGSNRPFSVAAVNETLRGAGEKLKRGLESGTEGWVDAQEEAYGDAESVVGMGSESVRGADAGLVWMDFQHMAEDAPPQVVGHTKTDRPTRKGAVVNANTIRVNEGTPGGESVTVATESAIEALVRGSDGSVERVSLSE